MSSVLQDLFEPCVDCLPKIKNGVLFIAAAIDIYFNLINPIHSKK